MKTVGCWFSKSSSVDASLFHQDVGDAGAVLDVNIRLTIYVLELPPMNDRLNALSAISPDAVFRLLGDETRLRALVLLHGCESLCVCELVEVLQLSQPKVSRHLAMLREAGLVLDERRGAWVHYRVRPDLPGWVAEALGAAVSGARETGWFADDHARLAALARRETAAACA